MALHWQADAGQTLLALRFSGDLETSIAKKLYYSFVIFQGAGVRIPVPPLDWHMLADEDPQFFIHIMNNLDFEMTEKFHTYQYLVCAYWSMCGYYVKSGTSTYIFLLMLTLCILMDSNPSCLIQ